MADSILNIVIRTRDESQAAFAEMQKQLKDLQAALKALNNTPVGSAASQGLNQVAASGNNAAQGIKKAGDQAKETADDFDFLGGVAKRVIGIFAGFFTIAYVKNLADGAARTQVLGTVLEQIAQNAGITADEIAKVDRQVQALGITAESSRQSLSQFIQSGLDITKAATLARAAQDLAVIAGRDSSQTFSRLITTIQQGNTVGLRWLGIVIDVETAVQKYAAANNVTAESISKSTRQQIILDAVLEESVKKQGLYKASMNDVGKQLQSLDRYQKEAADSAGKVLLPAYLVLVQEFTLFLRQATLITDSMNATSQAGQTLADVIRPIASSLRQIAIFAKDNAVSIALLAAEIFVVIRAKVLFVAAVALFRGGLSRMLLAVQAVTAAWKAFRVLFAAHPFGVVLIGVALLAEGLRNLWNIFADKTPSDANEKLQQDYQILIGLEEEYLRAKQETQRAESGRSNLTLQEAQAREKAIEEEKKALEESLESQEKALKVSTAQVKTNKEIAAEKAREAAQTKLVQAAYEEVQKAIIDLGVAGKSAREGLDISSGFEKQVADFNTMVEEYKKGINEIGYESQVTQGQLDVVAKRIATSASTTEEMTLALTALGDSGAVSRDKLEPLFQILELKKVSKGLEEAAKALGKFIEKSGEAVSSLKVLESVEDSLRASSAELNKELAKVGADPNQGSGLEALIGKLQVTAQSQKALAEAEIRALKSTSDAVDKRYKNEVAQIEATKAARIDAASKVIGNAAGSNAAVVDAERKAATDSVAVAKTKFDALVQLQNKYLSLAIATANEIKKIDEDLYNSKRTLEEKLFNLSLKGKTEEEKNAAVLVKIQEAATQAEAARLQGNFDLAKSLNDKRIALVDKISVAETATEDEKVALANELKGAYGQQTSILTDQKKVKEDILRTEIDGYTDTLAKIKEITAELAQFAGAQVVKLSVELDTNSLDTVVQQIRNAVSDIEITMKVKTEKFASGGLVMGPGTSKSDSILAALSNREYVMNADAVSRYGVNFMDMINRMALPSIPHFAMGGLVGVPAANDSGSSGPGDTVNLNINIGGQKVSLMGERNQVRKFVGALKNVEGV